MAEYDLTTATNLFKIKYGPLSENTYNTSNVLLGRCKKTYDFTGKQKTMASPTSFAGGVGSGSLPTANVNSVVDPTITAKKIYARAEIDRESIKASMSDEGAFVRGTKFVVQRAVESYVRNVSRMLFVDDSVANANGMVANGDGSTNVTGDGSSGTPYTFVVNSSVPEAFIEEKDYVNYDSETTVLEVVSYVPSTGVISLVGTSAGLAALSGSGPVPTTKYIYMQGSKGNDMQGLGGVLGATSGTLYGVSVARRWQAGVQEDAGGAGLTTDMINDDVLTLHKKCGKSPNLILMGYTQYKKFLNLLEDHKYYNVPARAKGLEGFSGFRGLQHMAPNGPIPVFFERFMADDAIWYLNDNYIEICHRPGHGWFTDDGTVFLRKADSDAYEARYGGYCEMYTIPTFHGRRTGLAL